MNHDNDVFVYLIAADAGRMDGPVKVGVASDPRKRLKELQTASPFSLKIVHFFAFPDRSVACEMEYWFHESEKNRRSVGEWFLINPIEALYLLYTCIEVIYELRMPDHPEMKKIHRLSGIDSAKEKIKTWMEID